MTRRRFAELGMGAAAAILSGGSPAGWAAGLPGVVADEHGRAVAGVEALREGWELFQGSLAGPWEVWHSEELAVFKPVTLPHSFNAYDGCDPDVPYYRGQGWYRTHLQVANPFAGGRTLLHFLGAAQAATVWVGETKAGEHEGGYDEWVVDITHAVSAWKLQKDGGTKGVPLAVMCENLRVQDRVPSDFSDFSLYGGLHRMVELVYVPAIAIERVQVDVTGAGTASPSVTVLAFLNVAKGTNAIGWQPSVEVRDPAGRVVGAAATAPLGGDPGVATWTFHVDQPELWSPKSPKLYTCTVTLRGAAGSHTVKERFGIRHFEFVEHGPFKLNGERLLLRGTHRHEDHAGYASAMPDELICTEMKLAKEMGANLIRLGHYQQNRLVLELCDELGILVWEEVPWCRAGIGDEAWKRNVREKLGNMIAQHRNHPSVILWGLGNEDDWPTEYPGVDKAAIRGFMTELRDTAHKLDASRLTSFRRCDFARDIPDVYSPSIWAGWYSGLYTEYEASLVKQSKLQARMLHIEWGADSHAGRHSEAPDRSLATVGTGHGTDERGLDYKLTGGAPRVSRDGDWSETYACNLFDWHLKVQEKLPWLTGTAQWIFKDFTTPLRVENPVPRVNQKGVLARDMTKKEAYFVFQSYWAEEPMLHLYGHTWPVRWGEPGEGKVVKVYSNCETVELFHKAVGGTYESLGVKRRNADDFPAAGLRWVVPLAAGKHSFRAVGTRGGRTVTDEIAFEYETRKWEAPAKLVLTLGERVGTLVDVEVSLLDAASVPCLDARNIVRFSLGGPGRLMDNQGTPWGSRVVQLANGRARITVEAKDECSVAVESEGIPSAVLRIQRTGRT